MSPKWVIPLNESKEVKGDVLWSVSSGLLLGKLQVRCLSETGKLRMYNSIAFVGCALFLTILSFIPASRGYTAIACLGLAAGCLGFTTGGFFKAAPLVSKHFSPFVTGNVSLGLFFKSLSFL